MASVKSVNNRQIQVSEKKYRMHVLARLLVIYVLLTQNRRSDL